MPPSDAPLVLVLGAQGRLGSAAVTAFAAAGWRARALAVPLEDGVGLAHAAAGARVVLHAANPAYTRWPRELLPMATRAMDVAEALGARLLMPANVYNFGRQLPERLTLQTPQHGDTRKGALRISLEALLRERARAGRLRSSVLRAGDFYGGGPGSWIDLVIAKGLRRGRLVYPGPLDRAHAWAYLPDLARAAVDVAAAADAPDFACWQFAGHAPTGAELLQGLQAAADAHARGWRIGGWPWWAVRVAGLALPMAREIAEMAYLSRPDSSSPARTRSPGPPAMASR
ncbi:NAD-dependent epimerase/dehydratase family protein [Piscinibacter sakaiensis]|uniref:NAD-dependent epimerase/dehydratase family protein n=1 Tax=Piscinibacter sakaiensis TaxID=1547922 RepID=UPI003729FE0D